MIAYMDTSVVLRPLSGQNNSLDWTKYAYSSEILGLEIRRVLDRLRLESALDDIGVMEAHRELSRTERFIGMVVLSQGGLHRAAMPMPTLVKTLDAVHLTSALMLREKLQNPLMFATHDLQQATAAYALGFEVLEV